MGTTLELRLPVGMTTEDVRRLRAELGVQLATGTVTAVVCQVDAVGDLATVDAVARLALVARRARVAFTLDTPDSELLGLVGLRSVLARLPDDP